MAGFGRAPAQADFDRGSGSLLERALFHHRPIVVALCTVITILLALSLRGLTLNASFDAMIPASHPFIRAAATHAAEMHGQGNTLKIVVETRDGDIFGRDYLETLKHLNDDVFLLPGVDRSYMASLWTTATRWVSVTDDGFQGGPIMADSYDGSPGARAQVRANIARSAVVGQIVAPDMKSSMILVPLLERDESAGGALDYGALSRRLELLRQKYQTADIRIHITGFAKIVGDLIAGLHQILGFFALSVAIATAMVYWYTRCLRSTVLVVTCSLIAVVWLLGLLPLLGLGLDPYSILVPFLVFAIGMSHGAQKMNGVMQDIGRGLSSLNAARMTFRRLFVAGFTALVCDAVGFGVLLLIAIQAIRSLAVVASIGVAILIFTNLILLPVLLSYVGVDRRAAIRSFRAEHDDATGAKRARIWRMLDLFTQPRWAIGAIGCAVLIGVGAFAIGTGLKTGDLDPGAPELRPHSRYNQDNAYLTAHYATSSDIFTTLVTTPDGLCGDYRTEQTVDRYEQAMRALPGVAATMSLVDMSRQMVAALNEGSLLWYELIPNQGTLNTIVQGAPRELLSPACNLLPVSLYLTDHKADTLTRVVAATQAFAAANDTPSVHFVLAAGNAGIEAATNQVVEASSFRMLIYVYSAVILLSLATFRSWRAVLVAVLPLMLTSVLAQALMVVLGIGLKVATLPVTALGVGIGVDYALYILSVTLAQMRQGHTLSEAYYRALQFTGKVVMLTGFTLAAAVGAWVLSPIKFQADMGLLLAFMFLLNMAGALILLPALACFLLPRAGLRTPAIAVSRPPVCSGA